MGSRFDRSSAMAIQFVPIDDEWSTKGFGLLIDQFTYFQVLEAMLPDDAERFARSTSNLTIQ